MNRTKFLEKLRASAVKLTPLMIDGWDEPVYLKPQTMADIRETLAEGNEGKTIAERIAKDSYYLERGIAKLLRDRDGNRLFDINDAKQMEELRIALDSNGPAINRQIQETYNALSEPDETEIDHKTKTEANPLGN